jgi:hypothetical protein
MAKARMFTELIAMIAPGQEMRAYYDSHFEREGREDLPTSHKVLLSYQDSSGHPHSETSVIDINAMRGTMFTSVKTVDNIGKSLEKIEETLTRASVLGRRGSLAVEASVEPYAEQQDRLAGERAETMRDHDRLLRRMGLKAIRKAEADHATPDGYWHG